MNLFNRIILLSTISTVLSFSPFQNPVMAPIMAMDEYKTSSSTAPKAPNKLSDTLYVLQHSTGVWFCAERLPKDGPRLDFWKQWVRAEYGDDMGSGGFHSEYKRAWSYGKLPKGAGFPQFESRDHSLNTGLYSLGRMLGVISDISEFWVLFACQNEIKGVEDIASDQIEAVVSLSTDENAPMSTHMGVNKSFQYLLKALKAREARELFSSWGEAKFREIFKKDPPKETDYIVHKGISIPLHAWGAKLMLALHPEMLYMITTPAKNMCDIIMNAFPGVAFLGDNVQKATQASWGDQNPQLKSRQIRENIKKSAQKRDELKYIVRELKEIKDLPASLSLKILGDKVESMGTKSSLKYIVGCIQDCLHDLAEDTIFTLEEFAKIAEDTDAEVKSLIKQEELEQTIEIQTFANTLPFDRTTSPIKRTLHPEDITQIYGPDRMQVVYEYNKTRNRVTIGNLVLEGDETKRFQWFNGGDMCFRNTYPYTTIPLHALAASFDK